MKISIQVHAQPETLKTDLLTVGVFESKKKLTLPKNCSGLSKLLNGKLLQIAQRRGFLGKSNSTALFHTASETGPSAVLLIGLGEKDKLKLESLRKACGAIYQIANKNQFQRLSISLPLEDVAPIQSSLAAAAQGIHLAAYQFEKYLTENKPEKHVRQIDFVLKSKSPVATKALANAKIISDGVCFARDLVNETPLVLNPVEFAKRAVSAGRAAGAQVTVYDEAALKKQKMELLLAVGKAMSKSAPARVVRIAYRPKTKAKKHIALVGKGVTFDTGGLDVKPAAGMLAMKIDMSGAAAVLAAVATVAKLKPNVAVTGYLGLVENGVGSAAYHPGDIIKSRKGLTVEVTNTDAEGRLVLADTIDLALDKEKPDVLVDVATLTGACMIALGANTAAIFCNNTKLSDKIISHGKLAGENFWPLPLDEELYESIKSPVADIQNANLDRMGGSIVGALFLKRFIKDNVQWAHLDIAGPAFSNKGHSYAAKGGTGFAVRTLVELICDQ